MEDFGNRQKEAFRKIKDDVGALEAHLGQEGVLAAAGRRVGPEELRI